MQKGMAIKVCNHYSIIVLICFSLYVIGCVFVLCFLCVLFKPISF